MYERCKVPDLLHLVTPETPLHIYTKGLF